MNINEQLTAVVGRKRPLPNETNWGKITDILEKKWRLMHLREATVSSYLSCLRVIKLSIGKIDGPDFVNQAKMFLSSLSSHGNLVKTKTVIN